ncbi:MAG TPA: hypothetical protein VK686_06625 [Bryobacteraceae bacterium]|jgi:hypothetical protein|nr:hypothetical protein [Bryobacteraceae bacterium]
MTFAETVRFFLDEAAHFVSPLAVAVQWELVVLAALAIWLLPAAFGNGLRPLRAAFGRLANHRAGSIAVCGILPIAIRLLLLGIYPVPEPSIHDEFSHLLLADTLVHGRISNPTHPMWEHFESIHIIQQPTYSSMYPPGQGAFLAFGEWLFHEPWVGVLLSVGLMFAAMCWMMQAWLPSKWALFGTLLAILAFGVSTLWINSYLSGAVSGIGGALVLGAVRRRRRPRSGIRESILLGIGIVLLMNTRPFEGMVMTAIALVYLAMGASRKQWMQIAVPAGLILGAGLAFTGYYNFRVTGSPIRMPYEVNRDTYGWPENLGFLPAKDVTFRHRVLRDMYRKEIAHHTIYSSWQAFLDSLDVRAFENWSFFCGPVLTIPLLLLPQLFRDRRTRPLVLILAVMLGLNLFQMVLYPYHLGPIVPAIFAVIAQGARHIYVLLSRTRPARALAFAVLLPLCVALVSTMKLEASDLGIPLTYWEHGAEAHGDTRAYLQAWLARRPKNQLVIVHYSTLHSPDQEWVYNGADIDHSKVVWAREMDTRADAQLIQYFKDREVWTLNADSIPQRVRPYDTDANLCQP